jgi:hypothetical protein
MVDLQWQENNQDQIQSMQDMQLTQSQLSQQQISQLKDQQEQQTRWLTLSSQLVHLAQVINMCEMCGCGKGEFMGESTPMPSIDNAGREQVIRTGNMFSTDSMDVTAGDKDMNA